MVVSHLLSSCLGQQTLLASPLLPGFKCLLRLLTQGGQGFPIKLRATKERSPFSKVIEPAFTFNGSGIEPVYPPRWRYLKSAQSVQWSIMVADILHHRQACGENPSRVYGNTRMDNIYSMRYAPAHLSRIPHIEPVFKVLRTTKPERSKRPRTRTA